jgi:2-polyprenyl-3-methyl-5-hydroxy-6-metoxy-1,4-benzoquinol methylase
MRLLTPYNLTKIYGFALKAALTAAKIFGERDLKAEHYVMGHSRRELDRLALQAANLRPITLRLLREVGLGAGMRVVDVGCGIGDVSLLAAELVGPSGVVTGIDRSAMAIATARERASAAGHRNIEFIEADAAAATGSRAYDVAVGRYVLIHQQEPAALIRAAASHVRPGGTVAFHELSFLDPWWSYPHVPLWNRISLLLNTVMRSVVPQPNDVAARMTEVFVDAGLGTPQVFLETPVGSGPNSPFYRWLAETCRTLLPKAEQLGLVQAGEINVETLEDELRQAATAVHAQVAGPHQHCGWVRV